MKTKTKRNIAKILGISIVLALLLAVEATTGDPLTRAWANSSMVKHAEKLYPNQTFHLKDESNGQLFQYSGIVQSDQSADTWFHAQTFLGFVTYDNHESMVEQKFTTAMRMSTDIAQQAGQILAEKAPALALAPVYRQERDTCFVVCSYDPVTKNEDLAYADAYTLDMEDTSAVISAVPCKVQMQILSDAPTRKELDAALVTVKTALESSNMPFAYYNITLVPSEGTHESILAGVVESGDVKAADIA
ncbi:MAG: hypothetical protein RRY96_06445 [Ruthenibacterium sp.]